MSAAGLHDPFGIVGTTISGKYQVESLVAEGGFGLVYRAVHKVWQQPVAIKCFKSLARLLPGERARLIDEFIQEGALLTELSRRSAAIVQARDVGHFTSRDGAWIPYLVLEWLEGRSLEAIIDDGQRSFPVPTALGLLEPVAMALDVVHRKGIAHRDIKPANIFVLGEPGGADMFVKVLDFGIAKVMQAQEGQLAQTAGVITSFTPLYAAPEQFTRKHGATGPWTDVFALALVFCELLTGRPALDGGDFIQLGMSSGRTDVRPTPRTRGAGVPDALEAAFLRALAVRPEDRFQTAGEFWNAVRLGCDLEALSLKARGWSRQNAPPGAQDSHPRSTAGITPFMAAPAARAPSAGPPLASTTPVEARAVAAPGRAVLWGAFGFGAVVLLGAGAMFFARDRGSQGTSAAVSPSGSPSAQVPVPPPAPPTCADDMVRIPGGKFFMGSDDGNADERPAHQVTLSSFCIDRREVTVADFEGCSKIGECQRAPVEVDWKGVTPHQVKVFSPLCNGRRNDRAQHPINCVDFDRAVRYCAYRGKRLPTEAEWEFAARGSDGRKYPWGDEEPNATRLNACGAECLAWGAKNGETVRALYPANDGWEATAPVGAFPEGASPFGLLDVVGNVWEWTSDWDGPYADSPQVDPSGPASGTRRIVRGGAFNGGFASWVRPTQRYSDRPETQSHAYGFRCAKSLTPTDAGRP